MTAASPFLPPSLPSLPLLPLKKKMIVESASGHDMIMCCVANANATQEVYLFEELRCEVAEITFDI
jgi:hypothetical protein